MSDARVLEGLFLASTQIAQFLVLSSPQAKAPDHTIFRLGHCGKRTPFFSEAFYPQVQRCDSKFVRPNSAVGS